MQHILEAIMSAESATDPAAELAAIGRLPVPETYRGVVVRAEETSMFDGMASHDKDPRKSLHLQEVPTPELGPGVIQLPDQRVQPLAARTPRGQRGQHAEQPGALHGEEGP